jgi:UDP-N-acetylglucosamine 2-epimerase
MKIATILGARPQFIKAAPVSQALARAGHAEFMIHTGQHYDYGMSQLFFEELGLPRPDVNLGVGSASHGRQTGQMLMEIEAHLLAQKPDWVLVYGDTNSTLAGALAAVKLHIPVAHVEAGLRSYNRTMPEEHNRVLTDHCADLLFCPTETAVANLTEEGVSSGVHLVGDVMYDALLSFLPRVNETAVLQQYNLQAKAYVLATIHRAGNTGSKEQMQAVLDCLRISPWPVVLPAHPRTLAAAQQFGVSFPENVQVVEPVGYLTMLALQKNARYVMTDSGGVQKEAFLLATPCITLRSETEWVETAAAGWNHVVGLDRQKIAQLFSGYQRGKKPPPIFGDGDAASKIVHLLAYEKQAG